MAPADKKLYSLRDVTATVASVPLITSSTMSKKLAESLDALVIDVKFGTGAFMKRPADAQRLAKSLVTIGGQMDVATSTLLTDMNQPLGRAIGNSVELKEAVETLQGNGPEDLVLLTTTLGGELLWRAGISEDVSAGIALLQTHLDKGSGFEKLAALVHAQGGDLRQELQIADVAVVLADHAGYVAETATDLLGNAVVELGGGCHKLGDPIDHSVGLEMLVRIGDRVERSQPLLRIFSQPGQAELVQQKLSNVIRIVSEPVSPLPLIAECFRE